MDYTIDLTTEEMQLIVGILGRVVITIGDIDSMSLYMRLHEQLVGIDKHLADRLGESTHFSRNYAKTTRSNRSKAAK